MDGKYMEANEHITFAQSNRDNEQYCDVDAFGRVCSIIYHALTDCQHCICNAKDLRGAVPVARTPPVR